MSVPSEYPALGYAFSVSTVNSDIYSSSINYLSSNSPDAEFQSISGIKATRTTEVYRALGMNNYNYQLPTTTSYEDLVLQRGIVRAPSDFISWCNCFINLDSSDSLSNSGSLSPKIVLVYLWDRNRTSPLMTWTFFGAYPKVIEYSGINASESAIAVETITLAYTHFETSHNPPS